MKVAQFAELLAGNNAIPVDKDRLIFNDFELYNLTTRGGRKYKDLEALLADNEDIAKIIEEAESFSFKYKGGRGSLSGQMGGGFTSSGQNPGSQSETIQNAVLNNHTAGGNSLQAALGRFRQKYGEADVEYGAYIDNQGFAHNITTNNKGAVVAMPGGYDGMTMIHNHPSGGVFSGQDLKTLASTKQAGVIATSSAKGNTTTYYIRKNQNFKPKEFIKAVNSAKWPKEYDQNRGADWWLRKNQQKFGYKYQKTSSGKINIAQA